MTDSQLNALSPLDGRYAGKCADLAALFSESALIARRVQVEVAWFRQLAASGHFPALNSLPPAVEARLASLARGAGTAGAGRVKALERQVNHDVKAVEYWLREELAGAGATPAQLEFLHFAATSEDVNNLAYALMLDAARERVLLPRIRELAESLAALARRHAGLAMLARTHGQPATPTTLGKEAANFAARLRRAADVWQGIPALGKWNGATGNFNAHLVAAPDVDWRVQSRRLVEDLGLVPNEYTTQIEPHDWIAEYCDALARADTVLIALCRDLWGYVSLGYFRQQPVAGEVGSSTMPHKVNPIDFENAEGNAGLANAMLRHFSGKLPVSRWQRDLSDSTVMRNLGVALGHSALAWSAAQAGLARIEPDAARIGADLDAHWEVLAEAIQTVMRANGIGGAYERLKEFSRGRAVDATALKAFVAGLGLPDDARRRLEALTPSSYTGLAEALARAI
ncbi:MAG: adenylosuccinate lyase [Steroidobacteraceae bacterium]|nr:adenylosuccinate lyase [Steroidobacteraceae bacterium]